MGEENRKEVREEEREGGGEGVGRRKVRNQQQKTKPHSLHVKVIHR